jgi:hypothetical protein
MPKMTCLRTARFLVTRHDEFVEHPDIFLETWFETINKHHITNFLSKLSEVEIKSKEKSTFVNYVSTLRLYEAALKYCGNEDSLSDENFALNLFKAYLILNTQQNENEDNFQTRVELIKQDVYMSRVYMFLKQYTYQDLNNFNFKNVFAATIIKSIEFFLFLENNYKNYLDIFYKEANVTDWRIYLTWLLLPIMKIMESGDNYKGIDINENAQPEVLENILKSIILSDVDLPEEDFTKLKSKPLIDEGDGKYLIVHNKFYLESIFRGVYFTILKKIDKKDGNNFMTTISNEFSEKRLLCNILNDCFNNKANYVSYSEELLKEEFRKVNKSEDGLPDYFLKSDNSCFVFESKDVFIKKEIKGTEHPSLLVNSFQEKFLFYHDKTGKAVDVGIRQLRNNIRRILTKEYPASLLSNDFKKIFPILIVHDVSFSCLGFTQLLNRWHLNEIEKIKNDGIDITSVQPLVVIDIDALILLKEGIEKGHLNFQDSLEKYIYSVSQPMLTQEDLYRVMESFRTFVLNFASENKVQIFPKESISRYTPELFSNNKSNQSPDRRKELLVR